MGRCDVMNSVVAANLMGIHSVAYRLYRPNERACVRPDKEAATRHDERVRRACKPVWAPLVRIFASLHRST